MQPLQGCRVGWKGAGISFDVVLTFPGITRFFDDFQFVVQLGSKPMVLASGSSSHVFLQFEIVFPSVAISYPLLSKGGHLSIPSDLISYLKLKRFSSDIGIALLTITGGLDMFLDLNYSLGCLWLISGATLSDLILLVNLDVGGGMRKLLTFLSASNRTPNPYAKHRNIPRSSRFPLSRPSCQFSHRSGDFEKHFDKSSVVYRARPKPKNWRFLVLNALSLKCFLANSEWMITRSQSDI
ncbi:hypothetical protein Tco_0111497 [Tanacetum coccineum]